jgi:hypothetical protein
MVSFIIGATQGLSFIYSTSLDQAFAHCPKFPTAAFFKKSKPCLSFSVIDHLA